MIKIKGKLRVLTRITLSGIVATIILSSFNLVYSNSGVHIKNETGATDYKWESNQFKSTMTEGFAWMNMDADGFNNSYPKRGEVDILLMGSSHMEAVNVPVNKNTGYLLNGLLPQYYTYNIGTSGHTFLTCIDNLKAAITEYTPSEYIVIETSTIDFDIDDIQKVMEGKYPNIPSYDSGMIYMIQKYIPLAKNLYKNLDDWWNAGTVDDSENMADHTRITLEEYDMVMGKLLNYLKISGGGEKLVVVYHPKSEINSDGTIKESNAPDKLSLFSELCDKNEILFIDTTEAFMDLYQEKYVLGHGFYNSAVGSGHLNQYGHQVIAQELAKAIEEKEMMKEAQ